MSPTSYDIVIVGGGFSGILAADILSENGLHVLLVDENVHLGGQFLRSHPDQYHRPIAFTELKRFGLQCVRSLYNKRIRIMTRAEVLGISPENELLIHETGNQMHSVRPKAVLLAPGAREKFIPFKGWTLPGIISTGATQILLKGSGVLPSGEILVAGAGIFPYVVASEILMNKGRVSAILDQNRFSEKIAFTRGLLREKSKISEAIRYIAKLMFPPTPVKFGVKVIEARGHKTLEEVLTVKIDKNGRALVGSETVYPCKCLSIGYGFLANTELAQQAGCSLEYDEYQGGWIVKVSEDMETSAPGIYAAGEITGIAGATKAVTEGKLAALAIMFRLGKISRSQFLDQSMRLKKERKIHLRFSYRFNDLHKTKAEIIRSIAGDTIVCRCEDITMGEIKNAINQGCVTAAAIKKAVRPGMGFCQGRTCGPILYEAIHAYTGISMQKVTPLSVRIPLKAVSLKALAGPIKKLHVPNFLSPANKG
jgi:NADPH-dependent 2,4-dienoyl-CoA reductase/sulfur reductase-like enzyme